MPLDRSSDSDTKYAILAHVRINTHIVSETIIY